MSDPSSTSLLSTGWVDILSAVDVGVMMAIGIVSFCLTRSTRVGEGLATLVPLLLGASYGVLEATERGWGLPAHVFKGLLMNGAGATITGRAVALALEKWWPTAGAPPTS